MSWSTVVTFVAVAVVSVTCLPLDTEAPVTGLSLPTIGNESTVKINVTSQNGPRSVTILVPSNVDSGRGLATDLVSPPLPGKMNEEKTSVTLFFINLIAVKNKTGENLNDVLHNDIIDEIPTELAIPLPFFLLVINDEDENAPVNLDEVAQDLEEEGFNVQKVIKGGEILLVKVDLDSVKTTEEILNESNDPSNSLAPETQIQEFGKLPSIRRKRSICLKCMLKGKKKKQSRRHPAISYYTTYTYTVPVQSSCGCSYMCHG